MILSQVTALAVGDGLIPNWIQIHKYDSFLCLINSVHSVKVRFTSTLELYFHNTSGHGGSFINLVTEAIQRLHLLKEILASLSI